MANTANVFEDVFINNRLVSIQNKTDVEFVKVLTIFRYEGLPLTMPRRELEKLLTRNGQAVLYMHEGDVFVTDTLPSEDEDVYGHARTVFIDHDGESLTRTIGVDAVLARNDDGCVGLDSVITEYAILAAQSKITMLRNLVDLRGKYVIQAKDQNAYESALAFEDSVRSGDTSVILAEEFAEMDGMELYQTPMPAGVAQQTIELHQYFTSLYYSELGITLNNNMKSQYVSDSEIEKSTGMPLIINMLECRQEMARDMLALFGVDVTVSLSSEWDDKQEAETNEEPPSDEEAGGPAEEQEPGAGDDGAGAEAGEATAETEHAAPEPEDVSREELTEATEAMMGEEVTPDAATAEAADNADPDDESDEDEGKGDDVETEEDDDED